MKQAQATSKVYAFPQVYATSYSRKFGFPGSRAKKRSSGTTSSLYGPEPQGSGKGSHFPGNTYLESSCGKDQDLLKFPSSPSRNKGLENY